MVVYVYVDELLQFGGELYFCAIDLLSPSYQTLEELAPAQRPRNSLRLIVSGTPDEYNFYLLIYQLFVSWVQPLKPFYIP